MNFSDARRSPGWIVLVATVAGITWGAFTFISHATSSQIYINNCGTLDYQPDVLYEACADGNTGVGDIDWVDWKKDGATGDGVFAINTCEPDCASGQFLKSRVNITLTGSSPLKIFKGKPVLTHIRIEQVDKKNLPLSDSAVREWDLDQNIG